MHTKDTYNVFVVDDSDVYRTMLVQTMKNTHEEDVLDNCHFYAYSSGEECLQNLQLKPDVLVLDYHLDGNGYRYNMDGLKLLKSMKSELPKLEVIIVSCQQDVEVVREFVEAGASNYIKKKGPASARKVQNSVRKVIVDKENSKRKKRRNMMYYAVVLLVVFAIGLIYTMAH
ncbi:MAG: response regulator transcription factor [Flavobacteriales bacterium]|nr:response regulator transcription factor [Flavobacteriales bacterium]MCB9447779.1 response regulator transcription factor [Flavobacteriales bacterium]